MIRGAEKALAILKGGGAKCFHPLKRWGGGGGGHSKLYPIGGGGEAQQVFDPRFSHFVAPLPVINYHSSRPISWYRTSGFPYAVPSITTLWTLGHYFIAVYCLYIFMHTPLPPHPTATRGTPLQAVYI